jgi:hypothetical protein
MVAWPLGRTRSGRLREVLPSSANTLPLALQTPGLTYRQHSSSQPSVQLATMSGLEQ